MESERKIVLLSDFIEQKVRKEKELEYYTQQLEELQKKLFFLNKEIELTNLIIDIIDQTSNFKRQSLHRKRHYKKRC